MRTATAAEDIHRFLDSVFERDVHAKRVYSLANATVGVITSASLAVHCIGQGLADARGLMTKHAVKQVDRLLSNQGVDVWALFEQWVPYLVASREDIVVAMDWTEFDADGHSTLMLALLTSHGRCTPLVWLTVDKATLKGRRNHYEDQVLERLAEVLPEGVSVTIVADRGFGDQKLYELLDEQLGFGYVIRFRGNIHVTDTKGETRPASQWVGKGGRARTLRGATVTEDHYQVGTVVCVQGKDMKEPWCLAISDAKASARVAVNYYAKRWGVECTFRDSKDIRFGMSMGSVRIGSTQRRDRLWLLNAFAVALLTLLGAAGESLGYDRHLKSNTVKRRTHSLFRQGTMLYQLIPNMPEQRLRPLVERFGEMIVEHRMFKDVFAFI